MPSWLDDLEYVPEEDWSGGKGAGARLCGGDILGASVYELPPGGFVIEHFHHASEEMLFLLRGRPTLRTQGGERRLDEGEAVHFPRGPAGARELRNDTDQPVRFVMAGTRQSPEVAEYPGIRKLTAQSRHDSQLGERLFVIHDLSPPDTAV